MISLLHFTWKIYFIRKLILLKLKKQIKKNVFLNNKEKGTLYYNIQKGLDKKITFIKFVHNFNFKK
jgi:hypothetical protein